MNNNGLMKFELDDLLQARCLEERDEKFWDAFEKNLKYDLDGLYVKKTKFKFASIFSRFLFRLSPVCAVCLLLLCTFKEVLGVQFNNTLLSVKSPLSLDECYVNILKISSQELKIAENGIIDDIINNDKNVALLGDDHFLF